jgi:FixJ family two-component response regulator
LVIAKKPSVRFVLLVDGDASLRRALVRAIQLAGIEVEAFASIEGLAASGRVEQAACLVLDVDMPGIGGIEVSEALIASGCRIPTVFMTASERKGLEAQLARLNPVAVLHKPFTKKHLIEALGRALGGECANKLGQ